jgi:hypothetical protein
MTKKWMAINIMLLLGAGLLGWQLYVAARAFGEQNDSANIAKAQTRKKSASEGGLPSLQPPRKLTEADFMIIPAQDLFSESRKKVEQVEAPALPETRTLDVKPILIGVLITNSQKVATVLDPAPGGSQGGPQGQRKTLTMRTGDNYRGFTVTDINTEGMVLEYGASQEVIPLFDTSKPPQSGKTPILATRVVNFAPGSGATSTTLAAQTQAAAAAQPAARGGANPLAASAPAGARAGAASPGGQARGSNAGGLTAVGVGGTQSSTTQSGTNFSRGVNSQGQQIINTPFGIMTVPAQPAQPVKK